MRQTYSPTVFGLENYRVLRASEGVFVNNYVSFHSDSKGTYLTEQNMIVKPVENCYRYTFPGLIDDHKELLTYAKKLFIHPSCKLSRTTVYNMYDKSLNPWVADAVVIPDKDIFPYINYYYGALFIHEKTKVIYLINIYSTEYKTRLRAFKNGDSMKKIIGGTRYAYNYNTDISDSELLYTGMILYIRGKEADYLKDLLTGTLPADKIVYDTSVQASLATHETSIDFDTLKSIKEMLDSKDSSIVEMALKTLATMDWMHYSNSIKLILNENYAWHYNKATKSTAVKYMLTTLSGGRRVCKYQSYDSEIYPQDFELFKQLYIYLNPRSSEESILYDISDCPFMKRLSGTNIYPILRTE